MSSATRSLTSACSLRPNTHGASCRLPHVTNQHQHGSGPIGLRFPKLVGPTGSSVSVRAGFLESMLDPPVQLPLRMNNTPHPREMRQFFYQDVCESVKAAVAGGELKMSLRCTIPETNPEMDVFRIGTLLELIRDLATALAADGKKVKVSVQQALGEGVFQGMPLSLSGVRRIMEAMDWGDAINFVSFGEVGAAQIDDHDYYILISPQNVVGNTIMTDLTEMADKAEELKKPIILVNPLLRDIPSAGGIMGIRGRKERMEYISSFKPVYHFRLLYRSGFIFPIKGALRYTFDGEWEIYKRINLGKKQEEYKLMALLEDEPGIGDITDCFEKFR